MPRCLISLGSNRGDPASTLSASIRELRRFADHGEVVASRAVESAPIGGPTGQGRYVNSAVAFETSREPIELLDGLQRLEERFGRRRGQRWASRTLDLDLLFFDQRVISEARLRVPHPRVSFRPFVLDPACEIAPDWRHPEIGTPLAELRRLLCEGADFVRLLGDDGRVADWIFATRPDVALRVVDRQAEPASTPRPRLTLVCGDSPAERVPAGPRLVLSDCPREHWAEEVAAALECVWPTTP